MNSAYSESNPPSHGEHCIGERAAHPAAGKYSETAANLSHATFRNLRPMDASTYSHPPRQPNFRLLIW
jgi:hypothetical protein